MADVMHIDRKTAIVLVSEISGADCFRAFDTRYLGEEFVKEACKRFDLKIITDPDDGLRHLEFED